MPASATTSPTPSDSEPVVAPLLKLALPTSLLSVLQLGAQLVETWLAARQGREALAGWAVLLPGALLMQQMSTGAMGGGVVSAVARALGAKRSDEARALVLHALLIATAFGALFAIGLGVFGRPLVAAVAGPEVGTATGLYAAVYFGLGALPTWWGNTLASVLRGGGRHGLVARVLAVTTVAQPALSYGLVEGLGWGLAGLGASFTLCASAAALALWRPVARGEAGFAPRWRMRPERALFVRILAVGAVASTLALLGNLSLMLVTTQLGRYGPAAVAAFGIAARLEFLVIPVSFGVGSAATAMVGRAVGAGDWARARRVAWVSGGLAFAISGAFGLAVALAPQAAARLFTADTAVIDIAAQALRWTGFSFGLFGLGMALYFASLGAGLLKVPALAAVMRLALAAGLGGLMARSMGPEGLFIGVALGATAYGLVNAAGVRPGLWRGHT